MKHKSRGLGSIFPEVREGFTGVPVVELAGKGRVLIEGHQGVTGYDPQEICVKMPYGSLRVMGCNLSLAHMSKERLVILGAIYQLCLC